MPAWDPDPNSLQFTLAVMPDTQFLYWGTQNSINSAPQEASFRCIINNSGNATGNNIVFMAHLGDLAQDADASSFAQVGPAFDLLDSKRVAYSVLAGNHDVSGDDTRGSTPYLQTMGPQRFRRSPRSPARTRAGTTPRTSSRRPTSSGRCWRWTGSPVVDNPFTVSAGITTLGLPWLLGAGFYAGNLESVFHGWIGDVRIVNRPLPVGQFMTGK